LTEGSTREGDSLKEQWSTKGHSRKRESEREREVGDGFSDLKKIKRKKYIFYM
jgi:hypothetical protein